MFLRLQCVIVIEWTFLRLKWYCGVVDVCPGVKCLIAVNLMCTCFIQFFLCRAFLLKLNVCVPHASNKYDFTVMKYN